MADADVDGSAAIDGGTDAGIDADIDAGDGGVVVDPPPGQPGLLTIGRFDTSVPNVLKFAWPGSAIIANFDGTDASVTLTNTPGFSGGGLNYTYFNLFVDDVAQAPFSVTGTQTITLATGLAAGTHKIEIQKRTEANVGTITFSGFTFAGGAGLLEPPPHQTKRIEWLTDSTMDGFGIDGTTPCAQPISPYNNARESIAWDTSYGLNAEMILTSYSGKGVARNEDGSTTDLYPALFLRTLPTIAGSTWDFATNVPDVVVVSVGGSDFANANPTSLPNNFQANYDALVGSVRTKYANAQIILTVWSQIKAYNQARTKLKPILQNIVTTRNGAGDAKVSYFEFPEAAPAVETGCSSHANAAHHQAMADLLKAEIQAKVAGF